MTNEADELGQRLAARLRSLADRDPGAQATLDDQARARVLAAMVRESARLARARRQRRAAMGAALALAACVLIGLSLRGPSDRQTATRSAENGVCSLPTDLASLRFLASGDRQQLALGRFGELAATGDAQLRIVGATPCTLTIALTRGTLAGDLHALRPATLRVQTALGDVEVRGTRFSVRLSEQEGALEVALLRGAVDVVTDRERSRLAPGQVLRRKGHGAPELDRLSAPVERTIAKLIDARDAATADAALRTLQAAVTEPVASPADASSPPAEDAAAALSPAAKPTEDARSSTELLAAAERERRASRLSAARALYREAGTRKGADAEVALLRWARLELSAQQPTAARDVLARYRQRFANGSLRAEASWLELRALQELGREPAAREAARQLIDEFPESPHAKAAQRLLSEP